jgi:hypothetical protein
MTWLFSRKPLGQAPHNFLMFERTLLVKHAGRVQSPPFALSVIVGNYEIANALLALVIQAVCTILVKFLSFFFGLIQNEAVHHRSS